MNPVLKIFFLWLTGFWWRKNFKKWLSRKQSWALCLCNFLSSGWLILLTGLHHRGRGFLHAFPYRQNLLSHCRICPVVHQRHSLMFYTAVWILLWHQLLFISRIIIGQCLAYWGDRLSPVSSRSSSVVFVPWCCTMNNFSLCCGNCMAEHHSGTAYSCSTRIRHGVKSLLIHTK